MRKLTFDGGFELDLSDGTSAFSVLARVDDARHKPLMDALAAPTAPKASTPQGQLLLAALATPHFDIAALVDDQPVDLMALLIDPPPGKNDERWMWEYVQRVFLRRVAALAFWLYLDKHGKGEDGTQKYQGLMDALHLLWGADTIPTFENAVKEARDLDDNHEPRAKVLDRYKELAPLHGDPPDAPRLVELSVGIPAERALIDVIQNGLFPRSEQIVEIDWRGMSAALTSYFCPSIRVKLDDARAAIESIDVAYDGKPWVTYTPADDDGWLYAQHAARVSLLLEGQLRGHLGRGHLVTEIYRLALERVWPASAGYPTHPFAQLIRPFLPTVTAIDDFGLPLVFGPGSIIAETSGLTLDSINSVLNDTIDKSAWNAWTPPAETRTRFEKAAAAFLRGTDAFLDAWFSEHSVDMAQGMDKVAEFTAAINAIRSDGTPFGRPWHSGAAGPATTEADLKKIARHLIFYAMFFHTWTNDQQWDIGGDPGRASFAFGTNEPPQAGVSYADWAKNAAPRVYDALMQCLLADVLAHTNYGQWSDVQGHVDEYKSVSQSNEDLDVLGKLFARVDPEITALADAQFTTGMLRAWVAI